MLQLGSRASGLTEVTVILAEHPEWDYGTCHLTLPVFSKESGNFTSKANHINPRDWHGDISVARVNLHTCWLVGRKKAAALIPDMEATLSTLGAQSGYQVIDMLSPLGKLLVNQHDEGNAEDILGLANPSSAEQRPSKLSSTSLSVPYAHEGDLEDALADEAPCNKVTSEIVIQGKKTSKARALRNQMAYQASRSSMDRLKRVQQLPCFDAISNALDTSPVITSNSLLGAPSLRIGNPIAILVRCEGMIVMAIVQVNRLKFAS
jgi:hypothetical protein